MAAKPTLTKVIKGSPGILRSTLNGLIKFEGLNKFKILKLSLLMGLVIFLEAKIKNKPVNNAGVIIARSAIRQSYLAAKKAPKTPATAPPTGTPAIRKEKRVPQSFLGVCVARIWLPAGAVIAYAKPIKRADGKTSQLCSKANMIAAVGAKTHAKISALIGPKRGKIPPLAAKNQTEPNPLNPAISPTDSGGIPDATV